jgi:hypothetical protein
MKVTLSSRTVAIPAGVTVAVKARTVTVTGKNTEGKSSTLVRAFKGNSFSATVNKEGTELKVDMWFGNRLQIATLRTICTHIENMIKGASHASAPPRRQRARECMRPNGLQPAAPRPTPGARRPAPSARIRLPPCRPPQTPDPTRSRPPSPRPRAQA